jgi:hypothetical protein
MFDPQDLLYTNTFTSTDILTDNNLSKENEYYMDTAHLNAEHTTKNSSGIPDNQQYIQISW